MGDVCTKRCVISVGARLVIVLVVWCGLLFGAAGDLRWTRGWLHVGILGLTFPVNFFILRRKNPELLRARAKRFQITATSDKVIVSLLLLSTLAIPVVAGSDAGRYGWAVLAPWLIGPGVLIHVAGDALILWAMAVNPFAIGDVRVQTERGHHVVKIGPYAFVRHPMYTGFILLLAAIPLVAGSGWTFLPVATTGLTLVIRTILEDHMLQAELPGYAEYAQHTRYRLVPGVW